MTNDDRLTWGFITDVLDVMERHGYHHGDHEHSGQAIGLIRDVALIYEGTLDAPRGGYVVVPSSQPTAPQPPGQPAVIVPADQVKTLLTALDDAAEYRRDRAEACSDCAGQSCTTCEWRLQTAGAYDQLAEQVTQAASASATGNACPTTAPGTGEPHSAADPEAGQ
jgi:ferredoxin